MMPLRRIWNNYFLSWNSNFSNDRLLKTIELFLNENVIIYLLEVSHSNKQPNLRPTWGYDESITCLDVKRIKQEIKKYRYLWVYLFRWSVLAFKSGQWSAIDFAERVFCSTPIFISRSMCCVKMCRNPLYLVFFVWHIPKNDLNN